MFLVVTLLQWTASFLLIGGRLALQENCWHEVAKCLLASAAGTAAALVAAMLVAYRFVWDIPFAGAAALLSVSLFVSLGVLLTALNTSLDETKLPHE